MACKSVADRLATGRLSCVFYSLENDEPSHVHVEAAGKVAKFWLYPVELVSSERFRPHELTKVQALVTAHRDDFRRRWNEHLARDSGTG